MPAEKQKRIAAADSALEMAARELSRMVIDPASSVLAPFLVLCLIALVTGGLALARVRAMVTP